MVEDDVNDYSSALTVDTFLNFPRVEVRVVEEGNWDEVEKAEWWERDCFKMGEDGGGVEKGKGGRRREKQGEIELQEEGMEGLIINEDSLGNSSLHRIHPLYSTTVFRENNNL